MARKRASMREGPLAELFRATEAAQRGERGEEQPPNAPVPSPSSFETQRPEYFAVLCHRNRHAGARNPGDGDSNCDPKGNACGDAGADNLASRRSRTDIIKGASIEAGTSSRQNYVSGRARLRTSRPGRNPRGTLHARRALHHRGALQVWAVESPRVGSEADGWVGQRLVELDHWDKHHTGPVAHHSHVRLSERSELHQRHLIGPKATSAARRSSTES